jgi:hypothetical protein
MTWLLLTIFCILLGLAGIILLIIGLINKNKKQYEPGIGLLIAGFLLLVYIIASAILGLNRRIDNWNQRIGDEKCNNTESYYESPVSFGGYQYYFWDEKPLVIDSNETNINAIYFKDNMTDFYCDSIFFNNGKELSIQVSDFDTTQQYDIWFVGRNLIYENLSKYSHTTITSGKIVLHYHLNQPEHFNRIVYLFIKKHESN